MAVAKRVILLRPRGFCAGVVRAIDAVRLALKIFGAPVYVRKEIVHNRHVVDELRTLGAVFVEELDEVPEGARIIFSAHGVAPEVRVQAQRRRLQVIDATCPLVTKVHAEALRLARRGCTVVLIGHRDHDEVIGTIGEAPGATVVVSSVEEVDRLEVPDPERVGYITQTTLSVEDTREIAARLRERFPRIRGPAAEDICYATQNRQLAVKAAAALCQLLLVIGSPNSSNSKRLVEVARKARLDAHLLDDAGQLDPVWLENIESVGVTAGASAPEHLVQELVSVLRRQGFTRIEEINLRDEDVHFSLPAELERASCAAPATNLKL